MRALCLYHATNSHFFSLTLDVEPTVLRVLEMRSEHHDDSDSDVHVAPAHARCMRQVFARKCATAGCCMDQQAPCSAPRTSYRDDPPTGFVGAQSVVANAKDGLAHCMIAVGGGAPNGMACCDKIDGGAGGGQKRLGVPLKGAAAYPCSCCI